MTAGAKIEHIIKLTEDYTNQLVHARKAYQYSIEAAVISSEFAEIQPSTEDSDFNAVAEAILYRIKGILDDSTV
jgi:hypothetical protein